MKQQTMQLSFSFVFRYFQELLEKTMKFIVLKQIQKMSSKGNQYVEEGRKCLTRSTFFGFGKAQKYEDAADNFVKAGNAFKLANEYKKAGEAFLMAVDALQQLGEERQTDIVNHLVEAANNYKKCDVVKAIELFHRAIEIYNDGGRFGMSARFYKEIAEIFEADNNKEGALNSYEKAADMFEKDNKKSNANTCRLKVANFSAEFGNLDQAASIFEDIGKDSLTSRLGAFGAKAYFFQALLCFLAIGDTVRVNMKLDEYKSIDHSFASSRECQFSEQVHKVRLLLLHSTKF